MSILLFREWNSVIILLANVGLETELPNGIKIYRDKQAVEKITHLVNEYPSI